MEEFFSIGYPGTGPDWILHALWAGGLGLIVIGGTIYRQNRRHQLLWASTITVGFFFLLFAAFRYAATFSITPQ